MAYVHLDEATPTGVAIAALFASILVSIGLCYFQGLQSSTDVPYVGIGARDFLAAKKKFQDDCTSLLREGYEKHGKGWFKMKTPDGDRVIMPKIFIDELKNAPRETLSFHRASNDILLGKYTGIGYPNLDAIECVKTDLTHRIGQLLTGLGDEAEYAFQTEFPTCADWTPVKIHPKLLRVISIIAARAFVPMSIGRTETWISASVNYTMDIFGGAQRLRKWNPLLRPFVYRFLPEFRDRKTREINAYRLLLPLLQERAKAESEEGYKKPDDFIQWMQDRSRGKPSLDYNEQALLQLQLQLAAIHTTGATTTHIVYDLTAKPEYLQPLRDEVAEVLQRHDGHFTKQALTEMKLMDSFMKESQRVNPLSKTTFSRKTIEPIRLSDGTYIPPGTFLNCNGAIVEEQPAEWGDCTKFDGYRFARLREESTTGANKYQFVTTSTDSLSFGHGKYSCPGRFFAAAEIKLIMAYLITHYDMKFADGEGRPKNFHFETQIIADPTKEVLMKAIKVGTAWAKV